MQTLRKLRTQRKGVRAYDTYVGIRYVMCVTILAGMKQNSKTYLRVSMTFSERYKGDFYRRDKMHVSHYLELEIDK